MLCGDFVAIDSFDAYPELCDSLTFSTTITNTTYLKKLYVKLAHARDWLTDVDRICLGRAAAKRSRRASRRLFTKPVRLVDASGALHAVLLELVSSAGQLHCRLSQGWQSFCRANAVALHDRLTFETRRDHDVVFVGPSGH